MCSKKELHNQACFFQIWTDAVSTWLLKVQFLLNVLKGNHFVIAMEQRNLIEATHSNLLGTLTPSLSSTNSLLRAYLEFCEMSDSCKISPPTSTEQRQWTSQIEAECSYREYKAASFRMSLTEDEHRMGWEASSVNAHINTLSQPWWRNLRNGKHKVEGTAASSVGKQINTRAKSSNKWPRHPLLYLPSNTRSISHFLPLSREGNNETHSNTQDLKHWA